MHSDDPAGVSPENEKQPEPDRLSSIASPNASHASNEPERAHQGPTPPESAPPSSARPGVAAIVMKITREEAGWAERAMRREETKRKRAAADALSSGIAEANKTNEAQSAAVETSEAAHKAGNVLIDHEELMGEWIDQMVNEGKVAADMLRVAKKPEEVREKCPRFFAEVLNELPESLRAEFYREARWRLFVPRLRYWIAKAQGIAEETAAKYQKKYRKKHPQGAGPK